MTQAGPVAPLDTDDRPPSDAGAALAAARAEFTAETTYLNTASMGLPPRRSLDAVSAAVERWRTGHAAPPDYDAPLTASRTAYAALVGVDPSTVTLRGSLTPSSCQPAGSARRSPGDLAARLASSRP